jgi:hypothetical protein
MGVRLLIRRPLWHKGISHPANTVIEVDEADALLLVQSGRAELRDPKDAAKLRVFSASELLHVMRHVRTDTAPGGGPWEPARVGFMRGGGRD